MNVTVDLNGDLTVLPDGMLKAQLEKLIQAGVSLQFSADGENWHNDQRAGDAYVRFKLAAGGAWTSAIEIPKITAISLAACSGMGEILEDNVFTMTWIDPDNVTLNGATLAEWNQTVLVRKVGSYPADHTDGTILATTSRTLGNKNAYRSTGYTDSDRTDGTTYYYKLFSQTTAGVWNNQDGNEFTETTDLSWGMVQHFVRAGRGPELFPVGTVFEVEHPEYTHSNGQGLLFRVSGHDQVPAADESLTHTMCLELVDCLFYAPYDSEEAFYALTADTTAQRGKDYYVYENSAYTKLVDGTDYDVGDPVPVAEWYEKNTIEQGYGKNDVVQSNMIQWLNSSGAAGEWFTKQNIWDVCGSTLLNKNGFLRYIDPEFLAVVQPAKLISLKYNSGGVIHSARFWGLSVTQLYGTANGGVTENEQLQYYVNGSKTKTLYNGDGSSVNWFLRSILNNTSDLILHVLSNETRTGVYAQALSAYSPACIIA